MSVSVVQFRSVVLGRLARYAAAIDPRQAAASTSSVPAAASSSAPEAASSVAVSTSAAAPAASGSISTTNGTRLVIDGKTGYFAGTNLYWIGFLTNNDDVNLVMQHLKESGLSILRVWGFNDVTTTPTDGTVW